MGALGDRAVTVEGEGASDRAAIASLGGWLNDGRTVRRAALHRRSTRHADGAGGRTASATPGREMCPECRGKYLWLRPPALARDVLHSGNLHI